MFETGTATDYLDLLEKLNTFLTTNGSAYGLGYVGTGNGTFTAYRGGASSVAETFDVTATAATTFDVVGSVSGSLGTATAGTPFSHAKLAFTITAGGTAFIVGDKFTLSTAPKWTSMRKCRGCTTLPSLNATGALAGENVIDGKTTGDSSRGWNPVAANIEFTFLEAETIAEYSVMPYSSGSNPRTWTFEYWNGSAWVTLNTQTDLTTGWAAGAFRSFTIASPVSATRYRFNCTVVNSSSMSIGAIELRRTVGGLNAAFSQHIWKAPGNNGTSEIYLGAHHFRRADIDYFDWELAAFDGHTASAAFYAQPGAHYELYVPLQNATTTYWFACNGRHARGVAKIGSQYQSFYLGFYDSYFTPAQLPYPIALGGNLAMDVNANQPDWDSTRWRWSNTDNEHRALTHSDPNTTSTSIVAQKHQLRARRTDGVWRGYAASHDDSFIQAPNSTEDAIWPYAGAFQLLDTNLDGSYALFPVVLCNAAPSIYGQLDGIAAVTGQGLTAETLIRIGSVDWMAVPNINRVDRDDWFAFKLD